jgi:PAS domain S-box-containing protein
MPGQYMALGAASSKRGIYYSYPVLDEHNQQTLGVAVIKISVEFIEEEFRRFDKEQLLLIDPHGIIFLGTKKDWLFHSLWPLRKNDEEEILASRQFGAGPWPWLQFTAIRSKEELTVNNDNFLLYQQYLEEFPGWSIIYIRVAPSHIKEFLTPALKSTGALILPIFLLIGLSIFFLYRKAASEIFQRKKIELALRKSETRYKTLYMHTPAMLHSTDPGGKILSVSNYWTAALGYSSDEVIGHPVTDFMTPESKEYALSVVTPAFLSTGFCKDIAYEFVKKDGVTINILLSAIAERDENNTILSSLAVLLDMTKLKQVETELENATEELNDYSRDLEKQVQERTREITNILTYTPAIIYMKNNNGEYLLTNSRFNELFNLQEDAIRGKTDFDIFPTEIAKQFTEHDQQALTGKQSIQVEEQIEQNDGIHTYLSFKFPLFDNSDDINGVGSIATDITDLKKAQNQLLRLSATIIESQENERTAIARELHDQLGQMLTALRMDTVWLAEKLHDSNFALADRSLEMCELIEHSIDEARSIALRLRPGILDDLGLPAAIDWLVNDFKKRSGVVCTVKTDAIPDIGNTASTAIYRITQEALTNIARHAGADHVDVQLTYSVERLQLTISDDGCGFDMQLLSESTGLGLIGIRVRTTLIGAQVTISSSPRQGTTVTLLLPLKQLQKTGENA